jgi:hypothetical protein
MNREDSAPSNRPRSENAHHCVGVFRRRRQQSRAGAVGRLPIDGTVAKQILQRRYRDRDDKQNQQDNQGFSHGMELVRQAAS